MAFAKFSKDFTKHDEEEDYIEEDTEQMSSKFTSLDIGSGGRGGLAGLGGRGGLAGISGRGGRGGLSGLGGRGGLGGGVGTSASSSAVDLPFRKYDSGAGLGGLRGGLLVGRGGLSGLIVSNKSISDIPSGESKPSGSGLMKVKSMSKAAILSNTTDSPGLTEVFNSEKTIKELCNYISKCTENSMASQNSIAQKMCHYIAECTEKSEVAYCSIIENLEIITNKLQENEEQNVINKSIQLLNNKIIEKGKVVCIVPGSNRNDTLTLEETIKLLSEKNVTSVNVVSNLTMLTNVQEDYTDAQIPFSQVLSQFPPDEVEDEDEDEDEDKDEDNDEDNDEDLCTAGSDKKK